MIFNLPRYMKYPQDGAIHLQSISFILLLQIISVNLEQYTRLSFIQISVGKKQQQSILKIWIHVVSSISFYFYIHTSLLFGNDPPIAQGGSISLFHMNDKKHEVKFSSPFELFLVICLVSAWCLSIFSKSPSHVVIKPETVKWIISNSNYILWMGKSTVKPEMLILSRLKGFIINIHFPIQHPVNEVNNQWTDPGASRLCCWSVGLRHASQLFTERKLAQLP